MYIYISFIVFLLIYRYKYQLLIGAINIYLYLNTNKKDYIKVVKTHTLENSKVITYNVRLDDKLHTIHIIQDANEKLHDDDLIIKRINNNINYKNNIVHCSLTDISSNEMIDLTSVFREFIFHFDKECNQNLDSFFSYVKKSHNIEIHDNFVFVVYMNDAHFTEYQYKLDKVYSMRFYDIVQAN